MKQKLAMDLAGESTSRIMTLDGTTAEDVIKQRKIEKFNDMVDEYTEKLALVQNMAEVDALTGIKNKNAYNFYTICIFIL